MEERNIAQSEAKAERTAQKEAKAAEKAAAKEAKLARAVAKAAKAAMPKKPKPAYVLFCDSKRPEVKAANPEAKTTELMKMLADAWKEVLARKGWVEDRLS